MVRMNGRRAAVLSLALLTVLSLLSGCGGQGARTQEIPDGPAALAARPAEVTEELVSRAFIDAVDLGAGDLTFEAEALRASPAAVPTSVTAEASGTAVQKTDKAVIDYSNVSDGYVMVQYTAATSKKLKCIVIGPSSVKYTYNLTAGKWEVFSLSDGSGSYQATVYENVSGTKYSTVTSVRFDAQLKNEFAPFLLPNQYVDYSNAPKTVAKAKALVKGKTETLEKVKAVYEFVVNNITYDKVLAANVKSGYLPVLDTVLANKTGICFDYASMMAAMLRSQGIPCKLVVGHAGTAYHAWINVWTEESGWINGAIFFDGTTWKLMDPTFASSGKQSESIMKYIGDGTHYTAENIY